MRQIAINLTDVELAYLAGLIDGEGCLNFYRTSNKSCAKGYTFVARLAISNCDVETLMQIREQLQIGRVVKKPQQKGNRKPAYNLCFYAREVRHLLPLVMPYLRIKRKQAELVLGFVSRQKWGGTKGGLSQEEHSLRESEHQMLRALNRRGIVASN